MKLLIYFRVLLQNETNKALCCYIRKKIIVKLLNEAAKPNANEISLFLKPRF